MIFSRNIRVSLNSLGGLFFLVDVFARGVCFSGGISFGNDIFAVEVLGDADLVNRAVLIVPDVSIDISIQFTERCP